MQSRWYSVSFSFQAGLTDTESDQQAWYYSSSSIIPTHLNVEADYLSWDRLLQEWHLLPQVAFHLWVLADVPQWCPIIKDLIVDVSVGQVLEGL